MYKQQACLALAPARFPLLMMSIIDSTTYLTSKQASIAWLTYWLWLWASLSIYCVCLTDHQINSILCTHVLNQFDILWHLDNHCKAVLSFPHGGRYLLGPIWSLIWWMIVFSACDSRSDVALPLHPALCALHLKHLTFFSFTNHNELCHGCAEYLHIKHTASLFKAY